MMSLSLCPRWIGRLVKFAGVLLVSGTLVGQGAVRYVNVNVTGGGNNGTSWLNAYSSLQSALTAATVGDQIWVAAGTYLPTADASGNASPADPRSPATDDSMMMEPPLPARRIAGIQYLTERNTPSTLIAIWRRQSFNGMSMVVAMIAMPAFATMMSRRP